MATPLVKMPASSEGPSPMSGRTTRPVIRECDQGVFLGGQGFPFIAVRTPRHLRPAQEVYSSTE